MALRMLYGHDLSGWSPHSSDVNRWKPEDRFQAGQDPQRFGSRLYREVVERLAEIDAKLTEITEHWSLERITPVDRNLLRIGVYEILHRDDIPDRATINDMIELAKVYGDEESSKFINGVLDAVMREKESTPNRGEAQQEPTASS